MIDIIAVKPTITEILAAIGAFTIGGLILIGYGLILWHIDKRK